MKVAEKQTSHDQALSGSLLHLHFAATFDEKGLPQAILSREQFHVVVDALRVRQAFCLLNGTVSLADSLCFERTNPLLSACHFTELDTCVVCQVLINAWFNGPFLLQDMFLSF